MSVPGSDLLKCAECMKTFREPVLLATLQTVCKSCSNNGTNSTTGAPDIFMQNLLEFHDFKETLSERTCDYCDYAGKDEAAVSLCLQCHDDLCKSCHDAHKKTKVLRNHNVVLYKELIAGNYDEEIRKMKQMTCDKHSEVFLEQFCQKCQQIVCGKCHENTQHYIITAEIAVEQVKKQMEQLANNVKNTMPNIEKYAEYVKNYSEEIAESEEDLLSQIEKRASCLHREIDDYKQSTLQDMRKSFKSEKDSVNKYIGTTSNIGDSIRTKLSYVNTLVTYGTPSEVLFLQEPVITSLEKTANAPTETMNKRMVMSFTAGSNVQSGVERMFGRLSTSIEPDRMAHNLAAPKMKISTTKSNVKLLRSFKANGHDDNKEIWLTGLGVCNNGDLVMVDKSNKKVKIFSQQGEMKTEFTGEDEGRLLMPFDVAVLKNGNVIVTDQESEDVKVYEPNGKLVKSIKADFRHPRGITVNMDGHAIVVDSNSMKLTVINIEKEEVIKTISSGDNDITDPLVDIHYVAVNNQGQIAITDRVAPNIKIYAQKGNQSNEFGTYGTKHGRILNPHGICYNSVNGDLFVADHSNDRIIMYSSDGTTCKTVLSVDDGIWKPMALAMNRKSELIVTEGIGDVKVFKITE